VKPARRAEPYLFLAPTVVLLALFFLIPFFIAAKESLYSWDLLTPRTYVGFANYETLAVRGELWRAFRNTMSYSAIVVTGALVLGLLLALLLDRRGRVAAFVRGAIFSAYVVSWVAVALLFMWLLDGEAGLLTRMVVAIGLPKKNWLGDANVALYTIAAISIWKIAGYAMIIFLAGLQDIPPVLYEAAALDGAGRIEKFRVITWPALGPSAAFVATTSLILSFQAFDVVRIMTQGGPVHATELFVYAIYEQIFLNLRVGRASALTLLFGVLVFTLAALQLRLFRGKGTA
jgi:sn-glycerol 3-phosphate transport system permease protein